jgi:hypothetical protein
MHQQLKGGLKGANTMPTGLDSTRQLKEFRDLAATMVVLIEL